MQQQPMSSAVYLSVFLQLLVSFYVGVVSDDGVLREKKLPICAVYFVAFLTLNCRFRFIAEDRYSCLKRRSLRGKRGIYSYYSSNYIHFSLTFVNVYAFMCQGVPIVVWHFLRYVWIIRFFRRYL